jgi:mitogen-activated protein kinase 15
MLTFEPNQRITLLEILKHPYLSEFASKCELKKPIQ